MCVFLVLKMTGFEGNSSTNPPQVFQMEALERMVQRALDDAFEPLISKMDRIIARRSQSVHNKHEDVKKVEQSPRQTPKAYLSWESKVEEEDDFKLTTNGEVLVVKRNLSVQPSRVNQ